MKRRDLMTGLGGAAVVAPVVSRAQPKVMPLIGVLSSGWPWPGFSPDPALLNKNPFTQALREAGYVDGQNVASEYRFAEGHYDRLPALAADLVGRKVDVILTNGGTPSALAAKNATSAIPIIFTSVGDPVGAGLVASLAHPGGNLTGFSNISVGLMPKLLDLLLQLIPQASAVNLLVNPNNLITELVIRNVQEAANAKDVRLAVLKAGTEPEIDDAIASLAQSRAGPLLVQTDQVFDGQLERIVAVASRHAVLAVYSNIAYAQAGGLMAYGPNQNDVLRQAGIYAGRILKGARPADLPVQQPITFNLVINLKTAKALGLTVPQSILARADEVIE
jgi:putative tryptophan/tyrosine transport system substrate-binding protein